MSGGGAPWSSHGDVRFGWASMQLPTSVGLCHGQRIDLPIENHRHRHPRLHMRCNFQPCTEGSRVQAGICDWLVLQGAAASQISGGS